MAFNEAHSATILVTGGTGLVGSHVIQALVQQGKKVRALYRTVIPDLEGKEQVEWIKGDILDVTGLKEATIGIEEVYHCAAVVSFNKRNKYSMFKSNIEGTANIVNAALNNQVKRLCYVSSVAALGKSNGSELVDENTKWSTETNDSNYGKSKYLAELEVWRGISEGLSAVIVNPAIILGAGKWNESSTKIFKSAYEEFPWYTEGVTGFVDVQDVVKAMILLMEQQVSGERFVLSADNKTYKEVFSAIATSFNKKPPHRKVTPFIAKAVATLESMRTAFTGEEPLITPETANAAQAKVYFNGNKIKQQVPGFTYTPFNETIQRVTKELAKKNSLTI